MTYMGKVDDETLANFLSQVANAKRIIIADREKNNRTRYKLGITYGDMQELVRKLKPSDYWSGPEKDRDQSKKGYVWLFKKEAYGELLYIKIKLVNSNCVVAISWHIDGEID